MDLLRKINYFNSMVDTYLEWVYTKSVFLANEIRTLECYLQESMGSLDLTLPSRRRDQVHPGVAENDHRPPDNAHPSLLGRNWKIFLRTRVQSELPVPIREFFLAEKLDENQLLTGLCSRTLDHKTNRLQVCRTTHQLVIDSLFLDFEDLLFEGITKKDDIVKMRNVSKYLKAYEVLDIDRFGIMYPFLVQMCVPLNSRLTIDMVRILCNTNARKLYVFNIILSEMDLIALIGHAQVERFDFWGLWSGSGPLVLEFDFYRFFMKQEYSRILWKTGFPYLADFEACSHRSLFLRDLMFNDERSRVVRTLGPWMQKARRVHKSRMMLIMDIFTVFGDFNVEGDIENYKITLVYLNRSLPEPYVTPSELYLTMYDVVVPEFRPTLEAIVQKYSEAAIFDDEYDIHSPRRLMHLCRVSIRKRLHSNFKLLGGIEDLDIPEAFKSYLNLES